jgi:CRISPR system Cascade subunit CasC
MRYSQTYQTQYSRSRRTRYLLDQTVDRIVKEGKVDTKAVEAASLCVAALIEGKTKPEEIKKYERADNGKIQHQVVPFSEEEIAAIQQLVREGATVPEDKQIDFLKKRFAEIESELSKSVDLDVALSGRMAASDLSYGVDGAFAVAHAITTHAVEPQDIDWFTAVDDLAEDSGETGAGHLSTQQFSAGVFYRYASLNLKQLQVNLGLIADMKANETADSRAQALKIAGHLFNMLATVVPTAKQQSFAAHNLADFAIVSFADQPISLLNAFEAPVQLKREGGYLAPSVKTLSDYWERMNEFYSLNEVAAAASSKKVELSKKLTSCTTINELQGWIEHDSQVQTDKNGGKDGSVSDS